MLTIFYSIILDAVVRFYNNPIALCWLISTPLTFKLQLIELK